MNLHQSITALLVLTILFSYLTTTIGKLSIAYGQEFFEDDKVNPEIYGMPKCNATERLWINNRTPLQRVCTTKTLEVFCWVDGGYQDCEQKVSACYDIDEFVKLILEDSYKWNKNRYMLHKLFDQKFDHAFRGWMFKNIIFHFVFFLFVKLLVNLACFFL